MKVNIEAGGTKKQILYVLWVLENFSDENNHLTQDRIVEILGQNGYETERRSVANDLKRLLEFGYNIHGVELQNSKNKGPSKRGAIWLERQFSDAQLTILLNSVLYNPFFEKKNKEDLIGNIISLGSKTFQEEHDTEKMLSTGNVYHVEGAALIDKIEKIEKAINKGKKIKFINGKLKQGEDSNVFELNKICTVSPYWIIMNKGNTYLVGYSHENKAIWHYRVDKIQDVTEMRSSARLIEETTLKRVDVSKYVSHHPLMFTGEPIKSEVRIKKDFSRHLIENFGDIQEIKNEENYVTYEVTSGELDMYYWAVQFGGVGEVLSPLSLRKKIREHIEGMLIDYKKRKNDRYYEEIRKAFRTRVLDLSGIDLKRQKEHHSLQGIYTIRLSNNNLTEVNFLENYKYVQELFIENNPITDLNVLKKCKNLKKLTLTNLKITNVDFLEDRELEYLAIDLGREVDLSALSKMKSVSELKISDDCSYNKTIPWDELKKKGINYEIINVKTDEVKRIVSNLFKERFPFNFLDDAFGTWNIIPKMLSEVEKAVEKVFDKFTEEEKKYLISRYKELIIDESVMMKELRINHKEYEDLVDMVKEKIVHPNYNGELRRYFIDGALEKGLNLSDILLNMIEIESVMEKREKLKNKNSSN